MSIDAASVSALWQAAASRRPLPQSLGPVVGVLTRIVPVTALHVIRTDLPRQQVELISARPAIRTPVVSAGTVACDRRLLAALDRWFAAQVGEPVLWEQLPSELAGLAVLVGSTPAVVLPIGTGAATLVIVDTGDARAFAAAASWIAPPLAAMVSMHELLLELGDARRAVQLDAAARDPGDHDGLSDRIIGAERGLRAVMERVTMVAHSDVPVLILGETGSGKEVIARAIHTRSPRATRAFVRVNCGAIPGELIDSELFGHERGSFTGAVSLHRGWFEQADGGTLFLDEVGELPLPAQVRLLRILQDGTLRRVGGHESIQVDVRIIAATHRDLAQMVRNDTFREDLWYRIAVFPLALPPLREHVEDLPEMVEFFARGAAARFDVPYCAPSDEDVKVLAAYPWPGNVRELAAVIDRAVLLGGGKTLAIRSALGASTRLDETAPASPHRGVRRIIAPLDQAMRRHIESALRITRGRIEGTDGAAEALEINPHTLRARMRKLGIDWQSYRDATDSRARR